MRHLCFNELIITFRLSHVCVQELIVRLCYLRQMVVNLWNILAFDELCSILVTHLNISDTARLSIVAEKVYFWMHEYACAYAIAKKSWAMLIWINGWSCTQISRINLDGYSDLLVQELFCSEMLRCGKCNWYRFYRLTPCIKCGQLIALNWVHSCGRPQKRDYSSLLKDVKWAYI